MRFKGSVALVTGASRGIGAQIAYQLALRGITVLVNFSRSKEAAVELAQKIRRDGGTCDLLKFDVSNFEEVESSVGDVISKYKRIDYLVNNAGITKDNLILRMSKEEIDAVIDVNLKGVVNCCKHVSKFMVKNKFGVIVNISSVVGLMGNAGQVNYAASKAGIIGLTKSLAKELGSRNIRVNAVAPGYIETEMTEKLHMLQKKALMSNLIIKRLGTPEDVANVVEFLLSEEASYITGEVINVSGGLYI